MADAKQVEAQADEKQGEAPVGAVQVEALTARVVRYIVCSESALFEVLGEAEREALRLPGASTPFSMSFDRFFQDEYARLCRGQDPSLASELAELGEPLGHITFCTLLIVARTCIRAHSRLDRSRLRTETKDAFVASLREQAEPLVRREASGAVKYRHTCWGTDIRKMDPDLPVFTPKRQARP
jgi:hypothetical protein